MKKIRLKICRTKNSLYLCYRSDTNTIHKTVVSYTQKVILTLQVNKHTPYMWLWVTISEYSIIINNRFIILYSSIL